VLHNSAQAHTTNVNKTWTLLQTTGVYTNRTSFVCGIRNGHINTKRRTWKHI